MSNLDSLVVTFQTQLSDVMETLVKTAMYEVTKLVEDGFLEEMKRRSQEVESLRVRLQWTERKLSEQEEKERGNNVKCVDIDKDDVQLSSDTTEQRSKEQQDDILMDCGVKREGDSVERWSRSQQKVSPETAQAADNSTFTHSPVSQAAEEEEDTLPAVDVKKEEMNKLSCSSVHLAVWNDTLDGEAMPESQRTTEINEAQPEQIQESDERLRNIIKQDPQMSIAFVFPKEPEDTCIATDPSLEVESGWVKTAGLLHNHRLATEKDCEPGQTRGSLQRELVSSVAKDDDVLASPCRDQISSSVSPMARLQNSDTFGVTIKQEVIVDSDESVKSEQKEKKTKKSGFTSLSCSVKQHRVSSEPSKQNHISLKSTGQEVTRLHSKVGTGLRLQAAIQHLHRPMRKPSHALLNSAATALSIAHSHVVTLNPLNRIPSTSKAPHPAPLSVQRVHLGDKQAAAHVRTGAPWVSIKTQLQSANSHHTNPSPHPDSHPLTGPRHLRCGQCGKCFPHPSNLKAHLQTHTGERPFCCSLCGRSFTKLSNLKAHRRVHTGERPYCCLACGKRFTQKCNLKRHQRIHVDV